MSIACSVAPYVYMGMWGGGYACWGVVPRPGPSECVRVYMYTIIAYSDTLVGRKREKKSWCSECGGVHKV